MRQTADAFGAILLHLFPFGRRQKDHRAVRRFLNFGMADGKLLLCFGGIFGFDVDGLVLPNAQRMGKLGCLLFGKSNLTLFAQNQLFKERILNS